MAHLTLEDKSFFKENGYLIKRGVLSDAQVQAARDALWDGIEANRNKPETWMPGFMKVKVPAEDDEETSNEVSIRQFYNTAGGTRMGWNGKEVKFVAISLEAKEITQWDRPGEEWMMKQYEKYDAHMKKLHRIQMASAMGASRGARISPLSVLPSQRRHRHVNTRA